MSRNPIYLPTTGPGDWRWLLASPGLQWKHGASAMALADTWEDAQGWPPRVRACLATDSALGELDLLVALPEHQVPLPGGSRASQTDLFVLARRADAGIVAFAVEGKAEEPFGDQTVEEWRADASPGRTERLSFLLDVLGLSDDRAIAPIRYQLLHRTASALIEAQRFGAADAVMLVHSFSPESRWFEDFAAFAALYGASAEKDISVPVATLGGIALHLAWVSDAPPPERAQQTIGPRFDRAVMLARELHAGQPRKGTEIPYIAHLLGVASLVLEDGGGEDEAIAALLHDAVEDQGGPKALGRIRKEFGDTVAAIVEACSDTDKTPKPPWRERKEAYLAHLREPGLPAGTLRVSLADKLHNARAMLFDSRSDPQIFGRFSAGPDEQRWYYRALAETFAELRPGPMAEELQRVVDDLFPAA